MEHNSDSIRNAKRLKTVLLLVAVHSLLTGVGLILQPGALLTWGGWGIVTEPFFPAQGGIFHILMALLYFQAARSLVQQAVFLPFIILVKCIAAVFLLFYALIVSMIWVVALSAVIDGAFALILYMFYLKLR